MMMIKNSLLTLLIFTITLTYAQDENLVPNGDFEDVATKTLKKPGMLDELCEDWYSSTKAPADIYSTAVKTDKVRVPNNVYGSQPSRSGNNYAGFRAYTKDKKKTRTYLAVKLTEDLEENQQYCIKMNISLADLSKYAVNYLGIYVSDRKTIQPNTGTMVKDAQIKHKTNKVMKSMDTWETICGTFTGTGAEEYIIIGCFERDDNLKIEKTKRPKGIAGAQAYDAYYFVDDVEVYAIDAKSQCICSKADEVAPDVIYSKSRAFEEDMTAKDVFAMSTVYYASLKSNINAVAKRDLAALIQLLKDNPKLLVQVVGHCDNDEFDEAKINSRYNDLGKKRADNMVEYLKENGISELRIVPKSVENTQPANTRPTPLSKAQNRRVQFILK